MPIARKASRLGKCAVLWLAAAALLHGPLQAAAKDIAAPTPQKPKIRELSNRFPDKPTIAPRWSIPVDSLGFAAPSANYLGYRYTMASLDFLGENRLLFTFRVPGLLRREPGNESEDQHRIRAVVLALPSGAVQSETNWMLHDYSRYLWVVDNNHFLLRDLNVLYEGDAELDRKPLLEFPGALLSIGLNPGGQYLVTNSDEPVQKTKNSGDSTDAGTNGNSNAVPDLVLRIFRRDSKQVLFVKRVRTTVQLPINRDGAIAALHGNGVEWMVNLDYFTGQTRELGMVKSDCAPDLDFLSESMALVTACSNRGDNALVAMTTTGGTRWIDLTTDRLVWPLIATARNGLRFVRESLYMSHQVGVSSPIGGNDIKGQWVRVFDAATGRVVFETQATPMLDAGGNVAISPSGRRVAVLNGDTIQVFELPVPPALSVQAAARDTHQR